MLHEQALALAAVELVDEKEVVAVELFTQEASIADAVLLL